MLPIIVLSLCAFAYGEHITDVVHNHLNLEDYHFPVIVNGVPVDTPEVQRAREQHLAAVHQAKILAAEHDERQTRVVYKPIKRWNLQPIYNIPSHGWRAKRSLLEEEEEHIPFSQHLEKLTTESVWPQPQTSVWHSTSTKWVQPQTSVWTQPKPSTAWVKTPSQWIQPQAQKWNNVNKVTETKYQINHPAVTQTQAWLEPQHVPVLDKYGVPEETPEVKLAKEQHLWAKEQAEINHNLWTSQTDGWKTQSNQWKPQSNVWVVDSKQPYSTAQNNGWNVWNKEQHIPKITIHGVPEETPEVQLAKTQHLAAHAHEQAKHSGWIGRQAKW